MKYLTSGRFLFSLLFVVVFAILIVTAMGYNPKARTFPLLVAIPVFIGAAANLVLETRAIQRGEKIKKDKVEAALPAGVTAPADKPKKDKVSGADKRKREFIGVAWLVGYVAALILFGFNLATLGYMLLFIRFYSHESWKLTIVYTAALWLFVYIAFVVLLKSTLAPGLIFEWFAQ